MKGIKEQFCEELKITTRHMNYILAGRRNAGLQLAFKLAQVTGTRPAIWMKGRNKARRVKAMAAELERRMEEL